MAYTVISCEENTRERFRSLRRQLAVAKDADVTDDELLAALLRNTDADELANGDSP